MAKSSSSSSKSSSSSSGGYSGYGGQDSPSERGGRGTTGTSSAQSASAQASNKSSSASKPSSTGGNNSASQRGQTVSSAAPSRQTGVSSAGQDRMGTGRSYTPSTGQGNSGAQNSASQRGAVVSASRAPAAQSSIGKGLSSAYRQVADTARSVGVTSIGGAKTPAQPSFRQAETASMNNMASMYADAKKSLLDTIAGPESAGRYDVVYGGSRFTDFSKHPGQYVTITSGPNKGKKSSAAGKYQFLESTWNKLANQLGLTDFSPESQDAAAFEYARQEYQRKTGRSLETDIVSQDPEKIANVGRALSGKWTSLPGGIEQGITAKNFTKSFTDKYMGPTIPDRPTDVTSGGLLAGLPSTGPVPSSRPQPPSQTAYVDPMVVKVDPPAQSTPAPRVAQVERFQERYLGTPATGPTPAARPQTEVAEAPKELTTGQKIAAGAIDIGAGFIPGVGTGLGIVNAGLQLTGNQTIGQRLVAGMGEGNGRPIPNQGQDREYSVAQAESQPRQEAALAPQEVMPTYERFVNTYIGPTPDQKWSRA